MKKNIIFSVLFLLTTIITSSQSISGILKFEQGQIFNIDMTTNSTISQKSSRMDIEFTVDANANHSYTITNTTEDNSTLRHEMKRVNFAFNGMGQKQKFDSDIEKDMKGSFGKPVKDMLDKKYDMIINPSGIVKMAFPEKIVISEGDSRMAIITNMLKGVTDIVQPPQKNKGSFFNVLPDTAVEIGNKWKTNIKENGGRSETEYTLSAITDSTVIIDFIENSNSVTNAEMMGNPTTTTLKNKTTGKIILNRATNIIQEKTMTTESTGSTESSFGDLPVTSKIVTRIVVKPS